MAPDSVEVTASHCRIGAGFVRTLAVTGYPRDVGPGWLEPLTNHRGRVDVAVHVQPVPQPVAADRLRRQRARLESSRRIDAAAQRLSDPALAVAARDAEDLAERIARGEGRLFRVGLYLTVHASSERELDVETTRLRGQLASMLLDAHPATFRALQGWTTTLPLAVDSLDMRRTFDTAALAAAFPFATDDLPTTDGVLYGQLLRGGGLLRWNRFTQPNHNAVILARSGAGKSYLAKLETLRSLYRGVQVFLIDPEDEYAALAAAVGGVHIGLGAAGVRINPFDLDPASGPDALTRRALFIHTLLDVLFGGRVDPVSRAALDDAILTAYTQVGISADPRSHTRPAPTLAGLAAALEASDDPAARPLARRLAPFVTGSWRGLFDGPSTHRAEGHLVVFSLRGLPDELKAAGTLLAVDQVWRQVTNPAQRRPRMVTVDEAWLLMRDPAGAAFLHRLAKAARKHYCGLTVITQDAADLLGTDLGQAVVSNAATQILLRQSPQAIDAVAAAFRLSDGERAFLLSAAPGDGLLAAGSDRAAFHAVASATESRLCSTSPEQDHPYPSEDR
ncbi:MAG TPA: DUF87 domain-containing protein [Mycobacteriales bacterium]|nr:DUF87 domain-containing protein [Mycobacteriales bacterium]